MGAHLRAGSSNSAALEVLAQALADARQAGRRDLEARILGQQGNAWARAGQAERGLGLVREGLALALGEQFQGETVEVLHRLADTLEHAGDYAGARAAYSEAIDLCGPGAEAAAHACRACLAVPLYQNGAWDRAISECRAVLEAPGAPPVPRAVAGMMLGTVLAHRGQPDRARPLLHNALALARQLEVPPVQLRALWGLALVEEVGGTAEAAAGWARRLQEVWEGVEDHYHVLFPMRWASSFFARAGAAEDLRRCVDTLNRAAALNGGPLAYSALAHALGELAWFEGHPEAACRQFEVAAELLNDTDTPYEEASTRVRLGQVLARVGRPESTAVQLRAAGRTARGLNAVVLLRQAEEALADLGRLALPKGTAHPALPGLSPRQLEVLRLVASGGTDKAIASKLRLSPRTVEMHVGRILASLASRSRTEAVAKAAELGLLSPAPQTPEGGPGTPTLPGRQTAT